jgi:glycosyltransferase involved in cell wall biosynthesis
MRQSKSKDICYFGSYDPAYSRNKVIIRGLELNNRDVYQCSFSGPFFSRQFELISRFLKVHKSVTSIIVGFPGHYDLPMAFLLGKIFGKRVIFDIFASKYETYVLDKKIISKYSPAACFFYLIDRLDVLLADYISIDTKSHGEFYKRLYKLSKNKMVLVYVGTDNRVFHPKNSKETNDVLFYGSYQPLQGVDVIIAAAKLLPLVRFKLIGRGQTKDMAKLTVRKEKIKNIEFVDWLPIEKLATEISKAKVVLGIFGSSEKAKVVIPNKVYDGLACQKAIITLETSAETELLQNGKNCVFIKRADPQELKSAIEKLLNNSKYREGIAKFGYSFYINNLTPEKVIENLLKL